MKSQMYFDKTVVGGTDKKGEERWRKKLNKVLLSEVELIKFNSMVNCWIR